MEKKLEVKNLKISFRTQAGKVQAVRGIDFDLYKGETLAIVGESGSGKSVTNRAVMGILAANGIIESGKILYDGQDLVQISEEDFHKIRGDKIAMIFQDPLSSLNPIMKIGRQLTEAMLLKNKASQKSARKLFNSKLDLLQSFMEKTAGDENDKLRKTEMCRTFDSFCTQSLKLEGAYNEFRRQTEDLKVDLDELIFMVEKKQKIDARKIAKDCIKRLYRCQHHDIVVMDEHLGKAAEAVLMDLGSADRNALSDSVMDNLRTISSCLEKGLERVKPDYFSLGYYMLCRPEDRQVFEMNASELNAMTSSFLEKNFLKDFIEAGELALVCSHKQSLEKKKAMIEELEQALDYFSNQEFEKTESLRIAQSLSDRIENAIDYMELVKNSTDYTFKSSILANINKYFEGIQKNIKENIRHNRQQAKWDKLDRAGKTPDWKVVPAALFDTTIGRANICDVISGLIENIRICIADDDKFNANEKMAALIAYLKEQASNIVYKLTKNMAKAKAIKIMEEVGIPEPQIRYNQYPFEFSGGMRQRIVIAIALSANPDILICDEPTTALDVTIQSQILELINNLKKERNLSVIFITHNLGVVANMADRIAVMYAGKLVEIGTADEVFYEPKHPYTWALLSSMPDLETKEKLESIPGTPPNMIFPPKGDAFAQRNKYAMQIDFEQEPPMFKVSDTHYAATWLLHPNAPKVDMPKIITERVARMRKLEEKENG